MGKRATVGTRENITIGIRVRVGVIGDDGATYTVASSVGVSTGSEAAQEKLAVASRPTIVRAMARWILKRNTRLPQINP